LWIFLVIKPVQEWKNTIPIFLSFDSKIMRHRIASKVKANLHFTQARSIETRTTLMSMKIDLRDDNSTFVQSNRLYLRAHVTREECKKGVEVLEWEVSSTFREEKNEKSWRQAEIRHSEGRSAVDLSRSRGSRQNLSSILSATLLSAIIYKSRLKDHHLW